MIEPVQSYVADGRVVHWHPRAPTGGIGPYHYAVDAELAGQPVPAALSRRTGIARPERFWPRWTATEVACKLLNVPVVRWLHRHGLADPPLDGLTIVTRRHGDLVISLGVTACMPDSALTGRIAVMDVRQGGGHPAPLTTDCAP